MKILFAAQEDAWGGVLHLLRGKFPQHEFVASGRFGFDSLNGFDILIPTMAAVKREHLADADSLLRLGNCSGRGWRTEQEDGKTYCMPYPYTDDGKQLIVGWKTAIK